jgi:hypothetical protein
MKYGTSCNVATVPTDLQLPLVVTVLLCQSLKHANPSAQCRRIVYDVITSLRNECNQLWRGVDVILLAAVRELEAAYWTESAVKCLKLLQGGAVCRLVKLLQGGTVCRYVKLLQGGAVCRLVKLLQGGAVCRLVNSIIVLMFVESQRVHI